MFEVSVVWNMPYSVIAVPAMVMEGLLIVFMTHFSSTL